MNTIKLAVVIKQKTIEKLKKFWDEHSKFTAHYNQKDKWTFDELIDRVLEVGLKEILERTE